MATNKELLKQRDLMDELLASRLSDQEHKNTMKVLDSIYFSDKLPKNVIPFPLNRIKRLNVDILTQQSSKENI
tara:strand:- start:56 stop:274 length:219 start_codon:yes stop_codon:yes gene_type:complete